MVTVDACLFSTNFKIIYCKWFLLEAGCEVDYNFLQNEGEPLFSLKLPRFFFFPNWSVNRALLLLYA
jgi:hypothetical protein